MGIRHGSRCCVFDCGGQQHGWRRIIGTCTGSQCNGNPISGIRSSRLLRGCKTALDKARKAAAKLSLWLTASLLIGAFAASLAATEGGYVRDNWNPGLTGR